MSTMQNFRKPDRSAPRYRSKCHHLLKKEFFDKFRAKYPQYLHSTDKELSNIITSFNGKMWDVAIKERNGIELPEHLGLLFIGSCKSHNKRNINYGNSIKFGKVLTNHNFITDGLIAKIFYCNYAIKYKYALRELWAFKATRAFKNKVAKEYPENFGNYMIIDNTKQIARLFDTPTKKVQEDYDEFDLN